MTIASVMTATAVTRPELETRPVGFAGMTGTYGVPVCENGDFVAPSTKYKVVTVKSDAELKTALGTKSGQIIMMEAGTYSGVSLSGYTDYSIIGKNGVKFTSTLKISGESKNILIRNVSVIGYSGDGMDITGNATNIWIDHCTIGWETTSSSKESPDGV